MRTCRTSSTRTPAAAQIGACHGGVVIDKAGNIYVTTDTPRGILVFSSGGKFLRAFGPTKIHALEIREEGGTEFIYARAPAARGDQAEARRHAGVVVKYAGGIRQHLQRREWLQSLRRDGRAGRLHLRRRRLRLNYIFKFDKDRKFVKAFGAPGAEEGNFKTCHGIALDTRGEKPLLFVCNRNNNRVEYWDLDGNFVQRHPEGSAHARRRPHPRRLCGGSRIAGPRDGARKSGAIVAQVGDNPEPKQRANFGLKPETSGRTASRNSPHGASIDKDGNLIVSEWSAFGHLHKFLRKNLARNKSDLLLGNCFRAAALWTVRRTDVGE